MSDRDMLVYLSSDDVPLIISLACSLDTHPGKSNWVEGAGGLPEYICEIAKDIHEGGKSISSSIAIAVSRVKKWAVTGKPETKVKAAAAIAQWEALKVKSHAKSSVKKAAKG